MSATQFHLATHWEAVADLLGDAPALIHGDHVTSWRQMDDRAARLAAAMAASGVKRGAKVAIYLFNCSEYIEAYYAALKLEAVPVNVNYRYQDKELVHLLTDCDAEALVFHASLADRVHALKDRVPLVRTFVQVDDVGAAVVAPGWLGYEQAIAANAPAPRQERSLDGLTLSYTGGTTGLPKGVMCHLGLTSLSACSFRGMVTGMDIPMDAPPLDVVRDLNARNLRPVAVPASPLMHSTGLVYASVPTLCCGGTVVTLTSRSFDSNELWSVVAKHGVTAIAIVGDAFARPMVRALEEQAATGKPYNVSSMRTICSAGVAWSAETKDRLFHHIPQLVVFDGCGASEGVSYGNSVLRKGDPTSTANFKRSAGLFLVDEQGNRLPDVPGQTGLLCGPTVGLGYYKDPEKTARSFTTIDGMPHVMPGDWGRFEADGTLTLLGRGSATINTGGEKVHPEEVEDALKTLAGVDDCLVFGMPDERFGQRVTALVQIRQGQTIAPEAVTEHARAQLAHYKAPRDVLFTDRVPRAPNGKPDYKTAKEVAAQALGK